MKILQNDFSPAVGFCLLEDNHPTDQPQAYQKQALLIECSNLNSIWLMFGKIWFLCIVHFPLCYSI